MSSTCSVSAAAPARSTVDGAGVLVIPLRFLGAGAFSAPSPSASSTSPSSSSSPSSSLSPDTPAGPAAPPAPRPSPPSSADDPAPLAASASSAASRSALSSSASSSSVGVCANTSISGDIAAAGGIPADGTAWGDPTGGWWCPAPAAGAAAADVFTGGRSPSTNPAALLSCTPGGCASVSSAALALRDAAPAFSFTVRAAASISCSTACTP